MLIGIYPVGTVLAKGIEGVDFDLEALHPCGGCGCRVNADTHCASNAFVHHFNSIVGICRHSVKKLLSFSSGGRFMQGGRANNISRSQSPNYYLVHFVMLQHLY